jgi:ABC-type nitrate/sulfonate/bicarbonate transport system substrate-binding protein
MDTQILNLLALSEERVIQGQDLVAKAREATQRARELCREAREVRRTAAQASMPRRLGARAAFVVAHAPAGGRSTAGRRLQGRQADLLHAVGVRPRDDQPDRRSGRRLRSLLMGMTAAGP